MNTGDNLSVQIKDAVRLSYLRGKPYFIGFLTSEELQLTIQELTAQDVKSYFVWGGFKGSERCLVGFIPPGFELRPEQFPIKSVKIQFPKQYELSHRDFLGALMSLGIKRSCVGDILISSGSAYVMLKSEISDYVISQLQKIGRVGVKLSCEEVPDLVFKDDIDLLNVTVSSLRLDNIISAVYNLSREKSSQAIKSGIVSVNHIIKQTLAYTVKQGETIVLKGRGKCVLEEMIGESKKGRKRLIIKKYR